MTAPLFNELLAKELIPTDQTVVDCACVCVLCVCAHLHVFCLSCSIMSILIAFSHTYNLGKKFLRSQSAQYLL